MLDILFAELSIAGDCFVESLRYEKRVSLFNVCARFYMRASYNVRDVRREAKVRYAFTPTCFLFVAQLLCHNIHSTRTVSFMTKVALA